MVYCGYCHRICTTPHPTPKVLSASYCCGDFPPPPLFPNSSHVSPLPRLRGLLFLPSPHKDEARGAFQHTRSGSHFNWRIEQQRIGSSVHAILL
jgi:hypothetical protein